MFLGSETKYPRILRESRYRSAAWMTRGVRYEKRRIVPPVCAWTDASKCQRQCQEEDVNSWAFLSHASFFPSLSLFRVPFALFHASRRALHARRQLSNLPIVIDDYGMLVEKFKNRAYYATPRTTYRWRHEREIEINGQFLRLVLQCDSSPCYGTIMC